MKLKTRLSRLAAVISEQADRDPEFAKKIEEIMGGNQTAKLKGGTKNPGARKGGATHSCPDRPSGNGPVRS